MQDVDIRSSYKWTFSERSETGSDVGFNEPMSENFKKRPYASLIREAIQNSLDVPLDSSKPVEMKISIKALDCRNYSTFCEIKEHIKACKSYYSSYEQADKIYGPMISYLNEVDRPGRKLHYIQISDYNTTGMTYVPDNNSNAFYAFVRAAGVSYKSNSAAGGSFGFGKAAYFYLSAIRTLFISTTDQNGNSFFEGVSSLCTHRINGKKVEAIGFYDCNNGIPVSNVEKILPRFKRDNDVENKIAPGTDINIMGIDLSVRKPYDIYEEMIYAVLRNFWLAIYENRLIVKIGETVISKDTLSGLIDAVFPDYEDNKRTDNYNPKPYLEAVKNAGTAPKYGHYDWKPNKQEYHNSLFPEFSEDFGKIDLYLFKHKQGSNKILYMRAPRMLVERKTLSIGNGYYGVFVATGGVSNKLLRMIENPAHDEWNYKNALDVPADKLRIIKKFIEDYKQFITESLNDFFRLSSGETLSIRGLDQYLYIPTDVDPEDDDEDTMDSFSSDITGEIKDEGTSLTTSPTPKETMSHSDSRAQGGNVLIRKIGRAIKSKVGKLLSGKSSIARKKPGKGLGVNGTETNAENKDGVEGKYLVEIPVTYRCFAYAENGILYHNIVVHSDNPVDDCHISLLVGGDESTDIVKVLSSSAGNPKNNVITKVSLNKGRNSIKIRFADNLKHSIKLTAYENK